MIDHRPTRRRRTLALLGAMATLSALVAIVAGPPVAASPYTGEITTFTGTGIANPAGITAGPDGALWFTNRGGNSIGRITTGGAVTNFTGAGITGPRAITAGPDGALWFTNGGNNSIGRITTDGTVTTHSGPGVNTPTGITAGPDGNLWFTNWGSTSIGRITPGGTITLFSSPSIDQPARITAGPDDTLWFTNFGNDTLGTISMGGVIGNTTAPSVDSPLGITAAPDGTVWFANAGNDSIGRVAPGGWITNVTHPTISSPNDVAVGADGNVWFTNMGNTTIGRVTPGEVVTNFVGPPGAIFDPTAIAPGPDNNLWFTNFNVVESIGRITSGAATGQLRVTTSPPLPATISVGGIPRDAWGLNWVDLPPGTHEVCFGPVPGYQPPPCEVVAVTLGQATEVNGAYAARGYLRVVTDPPVPAIVFVDGQPRNNWGVWTEVEPDSYSVCLLAPVADKAFPPTVTTSNGNATIPGCVQATVTAGQTTTVTATYAPQPGAPGPAVELGSLRVATDPAVGTRISVNDRWMDSWGLTWVSLTPGAYKVCFERVLYANTDPCQQVTVTADETTELTGSVTPHGFLRVTTNPPVGATIFVDGFAVNAWGVWTSRVPGTVEVCFGPVPGLVAPPCQQATIAAGATTAVTGVYS